MRSVSPRAVRAVLVAALLATTVACTAGSQGIAVPAPSSAAPSAAKRSARPEPRRDRRCPRVLPGHPSRARRHRGRPLPPPRPLPTAKRPLPGWPRGDPAAIGRTDEFAVGTVQRVTGRQRHADRSGRGVRPCDGSADIRAAQHLVQPSGRRRLTTAPPGVAGKGSLQQAFQNSDDEVCGPPNGRSPTRTWSGVSRGIKGFFEFSAPPARGDRAIGRVLETLHP